MTCNFFTQDYKQNITLGDRIMTFFFITEYTHIIYKTNVHIQNGTPQEPIHFLKQNTKSNACVIKKLYTIVHPKILKGRVAYNIGKSDLRQGKDGYVACTSWTRSHKNTSRRHNVGAGFLKDFT